MLKYINAYLYLIFDNSCFCLLSNYFTNFAELGTSEESGKDWSDLEAEAAAADKEDFNVSSLGLSLSA
jgi:hypothetical protein